MLNKTGTTLQYVVLTIDDVDLAKRSVHAFDKMNVRVQASLRENPGGILLIPSQGEKWTAIQRGYTYFLDKKLDSPNDATWVATNMNQGDMRLANDGILYQFIGSQYINDWPFGPTVRDFFQLDSPFTSVTLSLMPVGENTVQPFLSGLLISPNLWSISGNTLSFTESMDGGDLVVYYQTWITRNQDFGLVVGRGVISGIDTFVV